MVRCSNCGNENLILTRDSKLIENAKYGICSCGKVMIVQGDRAISTPTDNNEMTKVLIQDAADALNIQSSLAGVSLNGKDMDVNMQPTQVKQNIANYITDYIQSEEELDMDMEDEEDNYYDYDDDYYGYDDEDEECHNCTDCGCKDYLLITPDGNKNIYNNITTSFLEDIINNIAGEFRLYKLKEVKLKKEVVKTVKYKL